jgi:hypothetical protein
VSPIAAAALAAYGVDFVVVGGCALVLLDRESRCADLDIVPDLTAENMSRLAEALDVLGATARPSVRAMVDRPLTSVDSPYGRIDVLVRRALIEYRSLASSATVCRVEDVDVRVASVEDVLRLRTRYRQVERDQ